MKFDDNDMGMIWGNLVPGVLVDRSWCPCLLVLAKVRHGKSNMLCHFCVKARQL